MEKNQDKKLVSLKEIKIEQEKQHKQQEAHNTRCAAIVELADEKGWSAEELLEAVSSLQYQIARSGSSEING